MLAHPAFCDLVHSIGIASLCADDSLIWRLTKIYWSMVEFGVVKEGNEMKAFGAGEISSLVSGSANPLCCLQVTKLCL